MAKTLLKTRTFDELKIGNVARLIRYLERDATHCHRAAARELSLPKDIVNVILLRVYEVCHSRSRVRLPASFPQMCGL
jgi:hypothetical protein